MNKWLAATFFVVSIALTGCMANQANAPQGSISSTVTFLNTETPVAATATPASGSISVTAVIVKTETPVGDSPILASGSISLSADLAGKAVRPAFDLDCAIGCSASDRAGDVRLMASRGSMAYFALVPVNGALALPFGKTEPSLQDCRDATTRFSPGSVPEIERGAYICVLTNGGHMSRLVVEDTGQLMKTGTLWLSYTTWQDSLK